MLDWTRPLKTQRNVFRAKTKGGYYQIMRSHGLYWRAWVWQRGKPMRSSTYSDQFMDAVKWAEADAKAQRLTAGTRRAIVRARKP